MLFKKEWVGPVLRGEKRQTIRIKRPRLTLGRTYAVQTSYRSPSVGRVRITGVRPCTLAELDDADVEAEGWPASERAAFERYFAEINHLAPDAMSEADWQALRQRRLWCIDFEPAAEVEARDDRGRSVDRAGSGA